MSKPAVPALIAVVVVCLAFSMLPTHAADPNPQEASLHDLMENLNDTYRSLHRGLLRDADASRQQEYLGLVQTMQMLVLQSKVLTPKSISELPAGEQSAMQEAYRRRLIDVLATTIDLERALLDSNYARAKELAGVLNEQKRAGHEAFRVD